MSLVNNILADLREKRLWLPVIGLVALIAVVPMVLGKPGDPPPPEPVPNLNAPTDSGPELALSRQVTTGFKLAPRVNKSMRDPFGDRTDDPLNEFLDSLKSATDSGSGSSDPSAGTGSGGDTSGSSDNGTGSSGGGSDKPETVTDDLLTILVTKGDGQPEQIEDIRTLTPLPSTDDPFLVYVGKTSGGEASFLVSADVTVEGDGQCDPTPTDCRTLILAEGQSATFTLRLKDNEKIQVTVVALETKKVDVSGSSAAARAARYEARSRKVGARVLRSAVKDRAVLSSLAHQRVRLRPLSR